MKIITWLLSFNERHYKDAIRYEKSGWFGRMFLLILLIALSAGTLFVETWSLKVFNDTFIGGLLAFIVFVGLFLGVLEANITYAIFGFKMFVTGSLGSFAVRKSTKNKLFSEEDKKEIKDYSKYRYLDLTIGIILCLVSVAFIALAILFLSNGFSSAK